MRGISSISRSEFKFSDLGNKEVSGERLDEIVANIVEVVGRPAIKGRRVSRDKAPVEAHDFVSERKVFAYSG